MVHPRHRGRPGAVAAATMLVACLWTVSAVAAPKLEISVQPTTAEVGSMLTYRVETEVRGSEPLRLRSHPDFPSGLQVVGTMRSQPSGRAGGQLVQKLVARYQLRAARPGRYKIAPPQITVGDERIGGRTVTVEVVDRGGAGTQQPRQRQDRRSAGRGIFGRGGLPGDRDDAPRVFVGYQISPDRDPYVGEQVTLDYYLYTDPFRAPGLSPMPPDEPSFDDFWIEDLSSDASGRRDRERVDGKLYYRMLLRSYALFPLHAGTAEIEPLRLQTQSRGFFQGKGETLSSEPIKLDVKPLPPDAPPAFDEGNIGQWHFEVTTDRIRARVGDPITIRLRVTGEGQVRRVQLPELPELEGARRAGVDETVDPKVQSHLVGGTKTVAVTLVPTETGTLTIPPLEFAFFNPQTEQYETKRSEPIPIEIAEGELGLEHQAVRDEPAPDGEQETDVRAALLDELRPPVELDADALRADTEAGPWYDGALYWLLLGIPALGVVLLGLERPLRRVVARTQPRRAQNEAVRQARRRLEAAQQASPDDAIEAIQDAIRSYFVAGLGLPAGAVDERSLPGRLVDLGVGEDLARRSGAAVGDFDALRYAPGGSVEPAAVHAVAAELAACIEAIDALRTSDGLALGQAACALLAAAAAAATLGYAPPAAATMPRAPADAAAAAQQAYDAGDFARAADLYGDVARSAPHDALVLYNRGTALARAGDYGPARLTLERAARLAPWHDGIEHNREIVERVVRLQQIEQTRGSRRENTTSDGLFWWRFACHLDSAALATAAVVLAWLVLIALVWRRQAPSSTQRRLATTVAALATVGALLAVGARLSCEAIEASVQPAVLLDGEVTLRQGPSEHAAAERAETVLVPGVLLAVAEQRDGWARVTLADGTTAWLPLEAVGLVE